MGKTNVIKTEDCVVGMNREFVDMDDSRITYSRYARFFDADSPRWFVGNNSNERLMFLVHCEQYANDVLRYKGRLYLNDVYEMLGFPKLEEYEGVGWRYMDSNPIGDNYVDFNIYNEYNRDFINGCDVHQVLLDFNVDGYIGVKRT